MKRWWIRLVLVFLTWWAIPYTPDVFEAQSAVHRNFTVLASAAQTAAGIGGAVDVSSCLTAPLATTGYQIAQAVVTASSGTVTTFKVWLEVSGDGTNWAPLPSWAAMSITGTTPTASSQLIINETAAQSSGTGVGLYSIPLTNVRARWNVAGTTPSETFSVLLSCYN